MSLYRCGNRPNCARYKLRGPVFTPIYLPVRELYGSLKTFYYYVYYLQRLTVYQIVRINAFVQTFIIPQHKAPFLFCFLIGQARIMLYSTALHKTFRWITCIVRSPECTILRHCLPIYFKMTIGECICSTGSSLYNRVYRLIQVGTKSLFCV